MFGKKKPVDPQVIADLTATIEDALTSQGFSCRAILHNSSATIKIDIEEYEDYKLVIWGNK